MGSVQETVKEGEREKKYREREERDTERIDITKCYEFLFCLFSRVYAAPAATAASTELPAGQQQLLRALDPV